MQSDAFVPILSSVTPTTVSMRAHGDLVVTGARFQGGGVSMVRATRTDDDSAGGAVVETHWLETQFVDATRLRCRMPGHATPGTYQLRVCNVYNQQYSLRSAFSAGGYRVYSAAAVPLEVQREPWPVPWSA